MSDIKVIIGAGYGDEGKGHLTHYMSLRHSPFTIVVRNNGGGQAGHTVNWIDNTGQAKRHVFSHVGCGAPAGVPTFLGPDFIMNPYLFDVECEKLNALGMATPTMMSSMRCRVSTPYDMILNQIIETSRGSNRHGSCGVGIFETVLRYRSMECPRWYDQVKMDKPELGEYLKRVRAWAITRLDTLGITPSEDNLDFIHTDFTDTVYNQIGLMYERVIAMRDSDIFCWDDIIFEGAQGLLLAERYGTAPYLTPSDPGLGGVIEWVNAHGVTPRSLEACYVTRAYVTRHGNGPLYGEAPREQLGILRPDETNVSNTYQGALRYGPLNIPLMKSVVDADWEIAKQAKAVFPMRRSIAVTCLDHMTEDARDEVMREMQAAFGGQLQYGSYGPYARDIYNWG